MPPSCWRLIHPSYGSAVNSANHKPLVTWLFLKFIVDKHTNIVCWKASPLLCNLRHFFCWNKKLRLSCWNWFEMTRNLQPSACKKKKSLNVSLSASFHFDTYNVHHFLWIWLVALGNIRFHIKLKMDIVSLNLMWTKTQLIVCKLALFRLNYCNKKKFIQYKKSRNHNKF